MRMSKLLSVAEKEPAKTLLAYIRARESNPHPKLLAGPMPWRSA
jgi:hypothetical protein